MATYEFTIVYGRMGEPNPSSELLERLDYVGAKGYRIVGTSTDATGLVSILMERQVSLDALREAKDAADRGA